MPNRDWLRFIPYDMTLLINDWDEPMVSASFNEVAVATKNAESIAMGVPADALSVSSSQLKFSEFQKQNTWTVTSQACSVDSLSCQSSCRRDATQNSFDFIDDLESRQDVCQNCDLFSSHGLLLCPGNLDVAHSLIPIWSASKPSHFNDILYPSAYYSDLYFPETRTVYKSSLDKGWHKKENKFYWTGASTGGWATSDTWHHMQRQRLVLKTNNKSEKIDLLEQVPTGNGNWQPRSSTMHEISDLFSTRITRLVQCDEDACAMEQDAFGLGDGSRSDPYEAAHRYKFVFDIDGNGFSGRFYRLLQSRSVVVKQTILSEWHDDRLIPWVHYVPLSTSYDELPELARFLATTEEGLRISERIAKDSTEWHGKAMRDIDLQLVWLRAMLEFGRVMNPDVHE